MKKFNKDLPLSLKTQGGVIEGKPKKNHSGIEDLVNGAFKREKIGAQFSGRVDERVVYFDHGVGSVNFIIHGVLQDSEAILRLQYLAMSIIGDLRRNEESIHIFNNWELFQESMKESFSGCGVLYDMWGILLSGGVGRQPTRYIGENAILKGVDKSEIKIHFKDIPKYFAPFTGLEKSKNINLIPHTEGVVYLSEGWDGQIAIVNDPAKENWLMDLWQFATDYGTILHDFDRYLYERTLLLRKENIYRDIKQAKNEIDAIHRIELSIDVITHELLPHNFGGILEEVQVYRGIYYSWDMPLIVESLKSKFNYLSIAITNLNFIVSNRVQERINMTLLIFTILTFSGVLASVISTIDFSNNILSTNLRVFIISFGSITAVIFSILSIIVSKKKLCLKKINYVNYRTK
jgi:hypothetical protein